MPAVLLFSFRFRFTQQLQPPRQPLNQPEVDPYDSEATGQMRMRSAGGFGADPYALMPSGPDKYHVAIVSEIAEKDAVQMEYTREQERLRYLGRKRNLDADSALEVRVSH